MAWYTASVQENLTEDQSKLTEYPKIWGNMDQIVHSPNSLECDPEAPAPLHPASEEASGSLPAPAPGLGADGCAVGLCFEPGAEKGPPFLTSFHFLLGKAHSFLNGKKLIYNISGAF